MPAVFEKKAESVANESCQRLRITLHGAVQGVGFRPFVYRLASELGLAGWVRNSAQGVFIEVEGGKRRLQLFLEWLQREPPPRAYIQSLEHTYLDPKDFSRFEILPSENAGEKSAVILPDIAICSDCLREIFDSENRRYLYPFTNCTNCGPRFSIIDGLPYDRANTTMRNFVMCDACRAEYHDPMNRRFHAQPNACPVCGPHLELWNQNGEVLQSNHGALLAAAEAIRAGKIVAVKGLGGFHLMVDARNHAAVRRLRRRKHREEKPFAVMYPNLNLVRSHCELTQLEERLLLSPAAPIVLLHHRSSIFDLPSSIVGSIAPDNPYLGVMLPYTPLHHIIMRELGFPVVATSGNLSDEPICTDEREALDRLGNIADFFLVHNRPIARHVDDSVVRVMAGREMILRRARGYAPLPIASWLDGVYPEQSRRPHHERSLLHPERSRGTVLAVGAHLKNTVALSNDQQVFISQHIGDLETNEAYGAFRRVIRDFERLYESKPERIACDLHPDYLSTHYARESNLPRVAVQHHYAHVLSCMAENDLQPPLLGISWDGTGYGPDGTIWGGEFLRITEAEFERVAHLRTFCLPGGEMAVKEPRRAALGLLYEMFGDELFQMPDLLPLRSFSSREIEILKSMLARNLNSPRTSSAGRLFDAVAAIIGLRQITKFEGQAAMMLEFALDGYETDQNFKFVIRNSKFKIVVDWQPMVLEILKDHKRGIPVGLISAKFHNTLVEIMLEVARRTGEERVVLTGGCFQNKYLTERAVRRLREEGFRLYWHQRVPPNDGGIALGQVVAAAWELEFFRGLGHSEERSDEKSPDLMHRITPKLSLTESK